MKLSEQIKARQEARAIKTAARYKFLRAVGLTSEEAKTVMHWSDERIRTDPELLEKYGEIRMED